MPVYVACHVCWALLLLSTFPAPGAGALLRARASSGGVQSKPVGSDKLEQLLRDIDESVRKASGDAEIVFARILTYDQQFDASIKREIGAMNDTLSKLATMRNTYHSEISSAQSAVAQLGHTANNSKQNVSRYEAKTKKVGNKFASLLEQVEGLVKFLEDARVDDEGRLMADHRSDSIGKSPAHAINLVRQLLAVDRAIEPQYPDVFEAFSPLPKADLAFITKVQDKEPSVDDVRLSGDTLGRTVAALKTIQASLHQQKSQILLQLDHHAEELSNQVVSAEASAAKEQGIEAEKERQSEEVNFATDFATSLMELDQAFHDKVSTNVWIKGDLVEKIRNVRQDQLKTLKDLIDLLSGRFSVEDQAAQSSAATSFLQTSSKSKTKVGGELEFEAETAIHNHKGTHAILMRIKSMFAQAAPIDADTVQSVVAELGNVLREVGGEDSGAEEARQKCKSQTLHANHEESEMNANLALMRVVQNHTHAAIAAAKENLKGITTKTATLKLSAKQFSLIVKQSMSTLKGQSKDRATIIAAVHKANQIANAATSKTTGAAAMALLDQMSKLLQTQDKFEGSYRQQISSSRSDFLIYARGYVELLKERKAHYEGSLAALKLYDNEVGADNVAQSDSLGVGSELEKESRDLCDSIADFYKRHNQRRQELSATLKAVLPKVPQLLISTPKNEDAELEASSQPDNSDDGVEP